MPPAECEVLVIGAGPAGSACARWTAQAGLRTVLVDQHRFPRDKTCGDGLIPDAHAALRQLGLLEAVMQHAQPISQVRCYAPSGRFVDVPGTLAVLPRRELDHILMLGAQSAGAEFHAPWRFEGTLQDDAGRTIGARLRRTGSGTRETVEVRARQLVLATGAPPQALLASGMCERQSPSAMGLRGYVHHPGWAEMPELDDRLQVVWHSRLKPGYGWIFPCGKGIYNIGVGIIDSHRSGGAMRNVNLREVFAAFTELHAPARELMRSGTLQGELKGAPLRSSLEGATLARPGMLVTGEAAGATYSFTGEGIGKAMETGLLAARAIVAARDEGLDDAAVMDHYRQAIARLKPKFDLYEKGNKVNYRPWLTEILIRRAAKSPRLRQRMSNLLEEKSTPAQLVTLRGLYKLIVE
ncbi:MAG: geranylgeranyl reductase family protein [Rubrivivax sp.]|nr:geranylgeranyl reductase family protein [Rubrivivax sp.]